MANKDEWLHFIEEEDGEMFAFELIDAIILNSQRVLFEKQIDIQILPYTVNFAEQALTDMINFYYYQRDSGNIDATWISDEEPECVMIDSWAPAAVPIRKQMKPIKSAAMPKEEVAVIQKDVSIPIPVSTKERKITEEDSQSVKKQQQFITVPVIPKKPKKANVQSNIQDSSKKKLPSSLVKQGKTDSSIIGIESEKSITEDNKKFLSKLANAAENNKVEYTYDQNGRILPLNSTASWNPIQEVKYRITGVANTVGRDSSTSRIFKRGNKIPRIPSMRSAQKSNSLKQASESELKKEDEATTFSGFQEDPKLGIPLLADTMKIAPGVTLREGDVVKTAPEHQTTMRSTLSTGGKDITLEKGVFQISQIKILEDIIAHSKPVTANSNLN